MSIAALLVQLFTTFFMTGLIWVVQLVHYPLFAEVGAEGFSEYHRAHARRITWIVGPVMIAELLSALWLWQSCGSGCTWPARLGVLALVAIWMSTALLQMPYHQCLQRGFESSAWTALVATNWLRTALWTGRSGLLILITLEAIERWTQLSS